MVGSELNLIRRRTLRLIESSISKLKGSYLDAESVRRLFRKKITTMPQIKDLLKTLPQIGTLEKITIRPKKREDIEEVSSVEISEETGLSGDHYSKKGKRMVTLIQKEHLEAVASLLGMEAVDVKLTRRNLVVSGINLLALKNCQFRIGEDVILETTGLCHPCSRMEQNFGAGGYNAMRGHGGITTKVIKGGTINVGDKIKILELLKREID